MTNLIHEILGIIQFVREIRKSLSSSKVTGTTWNVESYDVHLLDIQAKLCEFLSSIIQAPLQGRMTMAMPHSYVPLDERRESLLKQKQEYFGH